MCGSLPNLVGVLVKRIVAFWVYIGVEIIIQGMNKDA